MRKHRQEAELTPIVDIEGMGRTLRQEMGGEVFDNAYIALGSPGVNGLGKGFSCSGDLIDFVDENATQLSKISKRLGGASDYRTLVGLACYIECKIKRIRIAA